jgi:hypothetical protein
MSRTVRGLVGLAVACLLGCGDEGDDESSNGQGGGSGAPQVTFTDDVHPILVAKCGDSSCHGSADSFLPGHGVTDAAVAYQEVLDSSPAGGPVYERILVRINAEPNSIMPPTYAGCGGAIGEPGCLTQAEYDIIEAWVEQGHPR